LGACISSPPSFVVSLQSRREPSKCPLRFQNFDPLGARHGNRATHPHDGCPYHPLHRHRYRCPHSRLRLVDCLAVARVAQPHDASCTDAWTRPMWEKENEERRPPSFRGPFGQYNIAVCSSPAAPYVTSSINSKKRQLRECSEGDTSCQ